MNTGFNPHFAVSQRIGGYGPFRLDPYFAFSDFTSWGAGHNDGFTACVEACRGRKCVIDIGAHVGLVTLPVASVLDPEGVVVAFEPSRVNRAFLDRHIELNALSSRVRVEPFLVGARELDEVAFFELDKASGMNTVVAGVLSGSARQISVPQTSLDAYCARHHISPEVIKIDVEGAELDVLEGARQVMLRQRPLVFLSVHPRQIASLGRTTDELAQLIDEAGYDCRQIDGSPVDLFALREYRLTPRS